MFKLTTARLALLSSVLCLFPAATRCQEPQAPTDGGSPPATAPEEPMHVGGTVIRPRVLHSKEPSFSKEARKAKISGDVQIYLWVEKDGSVSHIRVVKSVGYGLDEKAVEAVRKYKFSPATQDGEPVIVDLYIDVNFQIFDGPKP